VLIQEFQEDFNARELDILKLFQQGVSNKEAANALSLSVNTVRWYASRIFAKLSVKRRGQAVTEAVRLGLI
jgi:LuxR family maltose regulon positive regulatory protein